VPSEAKAAEFATALDAAFGDERVDSVLTCFIPPLDTLDEDVAHAVAESAARSEKPCVATFLGMRGVTEALSAQDRDDNGRRRAVPAYAMPEDAVRALVAATRYGQWRARDHGELVEPTGLNRAAAERLVDRVLADAPAGRTLTPNEAHTLLAAYGVELWPTISVETADDAVAAAEQLGYPVVVIRVDLRTEATVRESFESLSSRLSPLDADTFVVQRMATPGVACVVRTAEDPLFGPVVSFSIAGPPTDLLDDIGHRIPPLTDVDVRELISSVKASPLLDGHRGAAPTDRAALADLIARVSVLADQQADVASLEINPAIAHPGGVDVLGVEIVVAPATTRKDTGRRALT